METKAGIDALTFHGGDIVPGLLEVVLRVALALKDGRLGDGLQDDVVVRASASSVQLLSIEEKQDVPREVQQAETVDVLLVLRRRHDAMNGALNVATRQERKGVAAEQSQTLRWKRIDQVDSRIHGELYALCKLKRWNYMFLVFTLLRII